MTRVPRLLRQVFFLLAALSVALFLQFRSQVPSFTILHHVFRFQPGSFVLSAALIYLLLLLVWGLFSQWLVKSCGIKYKEALALDFPTYLPLLFFFLTPLALLHYLTFDDLLERLKLFLLAGLFAVFYLKAVQSLHLSRENQTVWRRMADKFFVLPLRRGIFLLFFAALLVFNAGALLMNSNGVTFSGDEPHYLLIAHSLLHDKDIDLTNNYAQQDYLNYMAPGTFIRAHTIPGAKLDSQYSFHSPGISLLMLPFYALGSLFGLKGILFFVRLGMSIFGALLGIQLYLYARQEWRKEKLALGLWFLFSFTSPVFFFSIHVYPELIACLLSLAAFRLVRFSSALAKPRLLLLGLLISSFLWFHALKYLPIMGPLFLYGLWALFKKQKGRGLAYFLALPAANLALYFYFQYSQYGSLNPTSVSWQGAMDGQQTLTFLKEMLTGIPFRFRWETLAGYFLDQRDGLLFYAPIYFFALLGFVEMARKKGKDFLLLLFIIAPYILFYAFVAQRAGYSPQARPIMAVIWGMVVGLGYFLATNAKKIFSYLLNFAVALSLLFVWILLQNPLALLQPTTVGTTERGGDLFYRLSNLHFYLPNWLPSYIKVEEWRWLPNFIWLGLLAVFLVAYLIVRKHDFSLKFSRHLVLTFCGLTVFFAWLVFYPRTAPYPPVKASLPSGDKLTFYGLSRVALMREPAKFSLLEDNRDYDFTFASWRKIQKLKLEFGSLAGDYLLRFRFFDEPEMEEKTGKEIRTAVFESPPAYRRKNLFLYKVSIHLERKSDVRTVLNPYVFAIRPVR
jgi:hypothetical protein